MHCREHVSLFRLLVCTLFHFVCQYETSCVHFRCVQIFFGCSCVVLRTSNASEDFQLNNDLVRGFFCLHQRPYARYPFCVHAFCLVPLRSPNDNFHACATNFSISRKSRLAWTTVVECLSFLFCVCLRAFMRHLMGCAWSFDW